jgi:transposase
VVLNIQSKALSKGKSMYKVTRVGVDLAKSVIQVHAVDAKGEKILNRALKRDKFLSWCRELPAGCEVVFEGTAGCHHWGRQLRAMGLMPKLIAAHLAAPFRKAGKHGKNDANDAKAVCEAAGRPEMHFIPIKSAQQQSKLLVHTYREQVKQQRTAYINEIRGALLEYGIVLPKTPIQVRLQLHDILEDGSNEMPGLTRLILQRAYQQWMGLEEELAWCNEQIAAHIREDESAKKIRELNGIGPVTASAVIAAVGDFKQFKKGEQFGAWLGLTPKQHSSGGDARLGKMSKHGNSYLRMLLIQGAKSAVHTAHKRDDSVSKWLHQLNVRVGWQRAAVALANKNARIIWAIMTRGIEYDPNYKSVKPGLVVATA